MSSKPKDFYYLFKLVIIGDTGSGKSCLIIICIISIIIIIISDTENYISTIGIDSKFRTIKLNQRVLKLQNK